MNGPPSSVTRLYGGPTKPPASGWYRFWLDDPFAPWVLTVYKEASDGFGSLEFVRSSHQPEGIESDAIEVIFRAEAGARYTIRLGARGAAPGGEFTLHWGESEIPIWLRYTGRLADGDLDTNGTSVQLRSPSSLALNDRGTALYAASRLGLQVFERDPGTGDLTFVQWLEDDDLEDSSLIWDAHRTQLYAHRNGAWRKFAPVDETHRELRDEDTLLVTGPSGSANRSADVFMDSGGSFIHTVIPSSGQLQVFAFDAPSGLRHVQSLEVSDLKHALISNDDSHVYAVTSWSLLVFERDAETGRLTQVTQVADAGLWGWGLQAMAISSDDRSLFVLTTTAKGRPCFNWKTTLPIRTFSTPCLRFGTSHFGTGTTSAGSPVREGEPRRLTYSARIWPSACDGNRPRCTVAAGSLQQPRA